ncbi:uncharacterized protein LOC103713413 [Phoenix dactylifera]|uniref:Uncharacterized protein LOC103713413 n=1 Tax=Phoenix dactylifera TaxID=42345 RepID=A0A8B7CG85_PHODC|nr:uncharacterized protein LOC103713413 [Phoenix dactylifera]
MGVDPWAVAMDSFSSVWTSHHERTGELLHKLLRATWELEALQSSVEEERREREEHINQLIQILKATTQERDEAREQLQVLLNKISEPNLPELVHALSHLQPQSPQIWQARGNSIVMESESLSEAPNHHSYGSSPAESFSVTSMHGADSCAMGLPRPPLFLSENDRSSSMVISPGAGAARYDRADAIIDAMSAKKPLPEKGKLLETMLKLGPTLETLMVAGSLPHWRNPPPLQSIQVPPVTIKACHAQLLNRVALLNSNHLIQSSSYEKANGLSRMQPASILEFSSTLSLHTGALPCVSGDQSLRPSDREFNKLLVDDAREMSWFG